MSRECVIIVCGCFAELNTTVKRQNRPIYMLCL